MARHVRDTVHVSASGETQTYDLRLSKGRKQFRRSTRKIFRGAIFELRESLYEQLISECERTKTVPENAFADRDLVEHVANSPWITIGGHTVSHLNLAAASPEMVREEVEQGRRVLQSWTGQRIDWFAYPYGHWQHYNTDVQRCIAECGFRGAVTTMRGYVSDAGDSFELPRFAVPAYGGLFGFRAGVLALNQVDWLLEHANGGIRHLLGGEAG